MTEYVPDKWTLIKITGPEDTFYKVLGSWSGGYLDGDSWRMNSGVVRVEDADDHWLFHGLSKSVYKCHKKMYGMNITSAGVVESMKAIHGEKFQLVDEPEDLLKFDWLLK